MAQFDVYVQEKLYKTITAENTGEVLKIVSNDIAAGIVPDFKPEEAHNIRIVNVG